MPGGLTATILTESYQVNLCAKNSPPATTPEASNEISIAAIRHRRTKKQLNLPVTSTDDIVYEAKDRSTIYRFDFNQRNLIIQPARGKAKTEKILASD
jgi:hypothetical protein